MPAGKPAQKTTPIRVVLTQRADLAAPLAAALRARGARPLQVPVTRWLPPPNPARFDAALAKAHARAYDWILFSNQHTVHFFVERYRELFGAAALRSLALAPTRLCAYGPMTARALRAMRLPPAATAADHKTPLILSALAAAMKTNGEAPLWSAVAEGATATGDTALSDVRIMAVMNRSKRCRRFALSREALPPHSKKNQNAQPPPLRFLVIRGSSRHATENVPQALRNLGARVEVLQGYVTQHDTRAFAPNSHAADMLKNGADWLVFASAMAIAHFDRRFGVRKLLRRFPNIRVAVTNKTLCAAFKKTAGGVAPSVIARPNDSGDLIEKIRGFLME